LANTGFESPSLAGSYQYAPAGAAWTFSGGAGITGNGNAFTGGNASAPEGVQVAFIQGPGSVAQSTTLAAGQYTISLQASQRGNMQSGTQIVVVQVDGAAVGQFLPPGAGYSAYQTPTFTIAGGGNHTISLSGGGSGSDFTAFVDSVVLNAASSGFTNAGFETPGLVGSYQYLPSGAAWTFTGGAGITGNGNAFTVGNGNAPDGVQVAFIQGSGSSIAQTVTLAAGQRSLSLQAAQRGNSQFGVQVLLLQVDGVTVGQFQPPSTSYTSFQTAPFSIVTAGSHSVSVTGVGTGSDFTAFFDSLTVQ
jgi:hypothetical protein